MPARVLGAQAPSLEGVGLELGELDVRARVRQATTSAIGHGQTTGIAFDVLERLASALGVEPGSLVLRVTPRARNR